MPEVCLENYSSAEVGARLADALAAAAAGAAQAPAPAAAAAVAAIADGSDAEAEKPGASGGFPSGANAAAATAAGEQMPQVPPLPRLARARLARCALPGGWAFWLAARGAAFAGPALVAPPGGVSLLSFAAAAGGAGQPTGQAGGEAAPSPQTGVLSLVLDAQGAVVQAAALARRSSALAGAAPALARLVGLPFAYVQAGLGLAAPAALSRAAGPGRGPVDVGPAAAAALAAAPWAEALAHDGFDGLRAALLQGLGQHGGGDGGGGAEGARVEGAVAAGLVALVRGALPGELEGLKRPLAAAS
jgi:hypothetical protein